MDSSICDRRRNRSWAVAAPPCVGSERTRTCSPSPSKGRQPYTVRRLTGLLTDPTTGTSGSQPPDGQLAPIFRTVVILCQEVRQAPGRSVLRRTRRATSSASCCIEVMLMQSSEEDER